MKELDQLVARAAVLSVLLDRVKAEYDATRLAVTEALGAEGRKNAVIDGEKLASVSVTKGGRVTVSDEAALTRWVKDRYPTEIYAVEKVRAAWLEQIKKASEAAGEPCAPDGTLDVPGISVGDPYTSVRKERGASEFVEQLWNSGRLSLTGELKELE